VAEWPRWRAWSQGSGAWGRESGIKKHSVRGVGPKWRELHYGWTEWIESRGFDPFDPRVWAKRTKKAVWMDRMERIMGIRPIRSTEVGEKNKNGCVDGPHGSNLVRDSIRERGRK
jgi:hypothetical protein